jgi:hypothetical protein
VLSFFLIYLPPTSSHARSVSYATLLYIMMTHHYCTNQEAAVKKRAETERKTAASGKRLAKEEAAKAEIADRASR